MNLSCSTRMERGRRQKQHGEDISLATRHRPEPEAALVPFNAKSGRVISSPILGGLHPRDAQRDVDLGRSASRASFIALMCSSMRGIAMHIPSEPDVTEGGCCKQTRTLRPLDPCRGREPLLKKLLR